MKPSSAPLSYAALLLILGIGTYGAFEARASLTGPLLSVTTPRPGDTLSGTLYAIEGRIEQVTRLRINGRPVLPRVDGTFREELLTPHGYGRAVIEAENRFGRKTRETIEFVGRPGEDPLTP